MITIVFLPHLKQHLQVAKCLWCLPFEWDLISENLIPIQTVNKKYILKLQMFLSFVYSVLQLVVTNFSPYSNSIKLQAISFTAIYATGFLLRCDIDGTAMDLLNALIKFEKTFFEGHNYKKSIPDKLMSLVLPLIVLSTILVPLFVGVVVFHKPCLAPFVGSMLPSCRNGEGISNMGVKIFLAIFETIMFLHVCVAGGFHITEILISVSLSMWNYLRIIKQWVASNSGDKASLLKAYKNLRVVEMLNNSCVQDLMLPACALGLPVVQFASGYVCIKLHDTMSLQALAFFALMYCDAVILTTSIITAPSQVYINSIRLLSKWKREWQTKKGSELRRSLRALGPIKVRFGTNFVDNSTPLVIQDMCTRQTASTLLISN